MTTSLNSSPTPTPFALPHWEFANPGPLRERLCGLALAGVKTATFDVVEGENPDTSTRWTMISSTGAELAVLEVIDRTVLRAADVTWEQVKREGESHGSVDDWRAKHAEFWRTCDIELTDDTMLIYETFRITEVLPAATAGRYAVIELVVPRDQVEIASAELYDLEDLLGIEEVANSLTMAGVPIDESEVILRVGFPSDRSAALAELEIDRRWRPRFEVITGDDWLDAWRESFEPFRCGRLVVTPAWWTFKQLRAHSVSKKIGIEQIELKLDPERAWGTGAHDSTRLVLEMLQKQEPSFWGRVLDIGCGSGILGIAARLLGWSTVSCIDSDPVAVAVTRTNAERNGVDKGLTASGAPIRQVPTNSYELVVANILAPTLIDLAPEILRVRTTGAPVLLAGLIDSQVDRVLEAFAPLTLTNHTSSGTWQGLELNDLAS